MKVFFLVLLLSISFGSLSQNEIAWTFSYDSKEKQVEMKAKLAPGWHVYSTDLEGVSGPIPTEFEFENNQQVALVGSVEEPQPKVEYDPNFEETVRFFEKEVVFVQHVTIKKKKNATLKGSVVYMICNDTMCLPPVEKKFEITLKK